MVQVNSYPNTLFPSFTSSSSLDCIPFLFLDMIPLFTIPFVFHLPGLYYQVHYSMYSSLPSTTIPNCSFCPNRFKINFINRLFICKYKNIPLKIKETVNEEMNEQQCSFFILYDSCVHYKECKNLPQWRPQSTNVLPLSFIPRLNINKITHCTLFKNKQIVLTRLSS